MRQLSEMGYDGIELSCQPHQLFPIDFPRRNAKAIRQLANDLGITISDLHAGDKNLLGPGAEPSLINPDPAARAKRLELNKAAIDLAVELGTKLVAITSGPLHYKMTSRDSWHYLLDGVHHCVSYANAAGVNVIVEPEPELFIRSITDFLALVKELGNPEGFGLNLDIGHSYCMYEDIRAVIHDTRDLLMHVHLEDIADRQHKHLIPGEGDIDFGLVQQALLDVNYLGYVSLELFEHSENPGHAASVSRQNLSQWMSSAALKS
ncbi:MAG TPA: sugar phosphate isomerase/epimerase family protein [Acidobacteriaceae bacterium]